MAKKEDGGGCRLWLLVRPPGPSHAEMVKTIGKTAKMLYALAVVITWTEAKLAKPVHNNSRMREFSHKVR